MFNTAHATYKRRWPLKADYREIPRPTAVALVDEFVAAFGVDNLLKRNQFAQLVPLRTCAFDPHDLKEAIEISINVINGTDRDDDQVRDLRDRLEGHLGPLHGQMAVRFDGWPFVIAPKAACV